MGVAATTWDEILRAGLRDPAERILGVDVEPFEDVAVCMRIRFRYRDLRGGEREGAGRVLVPVETPPGAAPLPLVFVAGYPVEDQHVRGHLQRGHALATVVEPPLGTAWPGSHPLERGPNLDTAFLHIVRGLPFVDDRFVAIRGGSAGGWMTLLLAAESFPVAYAMPDVPVLNWGYNVAYHRRNDEASRALHAAGGPPPPTTRWSDFMVTANRSAQALGDDTAAATWWSMSPLAHLDLVTCPVSAFFTTADLLVPIAQVGRGLERPAQPGDLGDGFVQDPDALGDAMPLRRRLLDMLPPESVTLRPLSIPDGTPRLDVDNPPAQYVHLSLPQAETQWTVGIIDEGAPDAQVAHFKYAVQVDRGDVLRDYVLRPTGLEQLTGAKLRRLMHRLRGDEWLDGLVRLDHPEAERDDVLRGLRTYCATPGAAARLRDLYAALPPELRALGDELRTLGDGEVVDYLSALR